MSTESAVKHTPGPWKMHPPSSVVGSLISWGDLAKGENVCAVMSQKDRDQCAANARLIAAAPALLEALEFTLNLLENLTSTDFSMGGDKPARDKMKTVIRQAKGE